MERVLGNVVGKFLMFPIARLNFDLSNNQL